MTSEKLPKVVMEHVAQRYLDAGLLEPQQIPVVGGDGSIWTIARVTRACRMICRFGHVPTATDLKEGEVVRFAHVHFASRGEGNRRKV